MHVWVAVIDNSSRRWDCWHSIGLSVSEAVRIAACGCSLTDFMHCRLAENPNVQVGVIEAGSSHLDDPVINTPGMSLKST